MRNSIKFAFLIIMLAIPAGIFTFLKFFGDNRFDVEIFHQNGVGETQGCSTVDGQYLVPDSLLTAQGQIHIVLFEDTNDLNEFNNLKARLLDTFGDKAKVIAYGSSSKFEGVMYTDNLDEVAKCGFIVNRLEQIVLTDSKNRIRGYYERDLDEIDRLIVETKIIVENEERNSDG